MTLAQGVVTLFVLVTLWMLKGVVTVERDRSEHRPRHYGDYYRVLTGPVYYVMDHRTVWRNR